MSDLPRVYTPKPRELVATRDLDREFASLNVPQQSAVAHPGGPLLIVAGAGTGKTRTLVHRVAHLIDGGVAPERILLLTFTRRAAQEMLARAERLVGAASARVHGGTFHGTANRLLRRFGPSAGLPSDFTILDQADAEDLMQLARAQAGPGKPNDKRFPKKETLHWLYSRHVNTEIPLETLLADELSAFVEHEPAIRAVLRDYTRRKADRNLLDYDDLLLSWAMLLERGGELATRIAALYDHVLVDEYQDTNALQARILRGMCAGHRNLTVVGDDAQSIYSFRGATVRNILDFPRDFSGTTLIALEQNYRSVPPILEVSNAVMAKATEGYRKALWTDRSGGERPWLVACRDEPQQTRFIADRILELYEEGIPLAEMGVLVRAGYMSADLEIELQRRGIPFDKWGGLKFLEAAHVKDVLAFLRILENPRDEVSWYRILLLMPGIGEATARSAVDAMAAGAWAPAAFRSFSPPPRAQAAHRALAALLDSLRENVPVENGVSGAVGLEIARIRTLYDELLRERYDRPEARLSDLDQLQTIAAGYPDRTAFLTALALEPPQATQDLASGAEGADDALVISTIHSAKGREWDVVFVPWAVDGYLPLARSLATEEGAEEERRLAYVALTRARKHLYVTYPLNAYVSRRGADYSLDQVSRFLDRDVRALMQRAALGDDDRPAVDDSPPRAPVDLRALLGGRF
ncbi:MAG: ATP-dependent helicase [Gemmatimonadaceae bacterium]|nr:ATP-dependent helicase [Gemmatimonadaceae bacterium]